MKRVHFSMIVATLFLFVFTILCKYDIPLEVALALFSFSPFVVIWMVITILKQGCYHGPTLQPDQEFGYQDRPSGFSAIAHKQLNNKS